MRYLILIFLISFAVSAEMTCFIGAEYTTDGAVTCAWDASETAEFYELRVQWIDVTPAVIYNIDRTSLLELEVNLPRSGHFEFHVRAGKWSETEQAEVYSTWSESTNIECATVDGEPMAWRVCKKLATPEW